MPTEAPRSAIAGWYGKLPSLGDFASRRLEARFIEPWDAWLGEGLAAQRERLGDAWLDAYLASPAWRFVLMPGAVAGTDVAQGGVLMPSVDRVGRYFPLTLVAELEPLPASAEGLEGLLGWLHRLEDVALDALQDDWSIDDLEDALARLEPPVGTAETPLAQAAFARALQGAGAFVPIEGVAGRSELARLVVAALAPSVAPAAHAALAGLAFWLADHPERPQLLVSRGLPRGDEFARLFTAAAREVGAASTGLETLL